MKKLLIMAGALCALCILSNAGNITPSKKLQLAEAIVANYYVDTINEDKVVEDAIVGMLKELDPHSTYTNAEETKEMTEPLEGSFSGVGITFNMNQDTLYVLQTISGGPSERVGILAGDRIVSVNDTVIAGVKMKNSNIMKRLRGPKGTKVNVKVLRRNAGQPDKTIDFTITRADIPIHSVDAAYMADATTGYVKLNKFAANTYEEFVEAVNKLKGKGMQNIIIDLTDNGGGYLGTAGEILGEILEPGSPAVYTEGTNSERQVFTASPSKRTPLLQGCKIVVMINQYSASASEIVTGAIQDWDRGVVVGRRSFGKGLVQRPFPFPDGSMIKLTVAHYYTPSGRDIQKPYTKGNQKDYAQDILDRYNRGELMHADSIHYVDSLKVNTLRNRRVIYGGGGISPDKFVPLDTTRMTDYYRNVMAKGLMNQYSVAYTDAHRKDVKKRYKDEDAFAEQFIVTDDMLKELVAMADKEKVEYNEEQFQCSKSLFQDVIKSLIGRDVYTDETFYKIWNRSNDIYLEALRMINSPEYDTLLGD
jgi:carboxyl-terminal processing protease